MKTRELIALIGEEPARRIMAAYGGEAHYIPKGAAFDIEERNRRVLADLEAGHPVRKVALKHRVSRRLVQYIKRQHMAE